MKLYHIDRSGHVKPNQILDFTKDFYTEKTDNEYFNEGLSSHGVCYYLNDFQNKDFAIEIIFEYERMLHFPNKLSRLQALFAFELIGVVDFVNKKELDYNYFKVFEIETDNYEKHNMSLVRGWSFSSTSKYAKLYWTDGEDVLKDRVPVYEYIIKLPIKIGKEVAYKDLLDEYNKLNPPKEEKK